MSLSSSARTRLGIRTAMAVVAVAGLLLIENDTALLLFLVAICVLALSISHLIGESPEEAEGFRVAWDATQAARSERSA